MTPPPQQKPRFVSSGSPTFSTLGRSPSISPPAYTTDDILAARNSKYSRWVYMLRLGITATTLAASIVVTALAGVSLRNYTDSHLGAEWLLPLWPSRVDLRPTHTLLGCGITILVLSLAYLAAAFAPMVWPRFPICISVLADINTGSKQAAHPQYRLNHPLLPLPGCLPVHHHLRFHCYQQPFLQHISGYSELLDMQMARL